MSFYGIITLDGKVISRVQIELTLPEFKPTAKYYGMQSGYGGPWLNRGEVTTICTGTSEFDFMDQDVKIWTGAPASRNF